VLDKGFGWTPSATLQQWVKMLDYLLQASCFNFEVVSTSMSYLMSAHRNVDAPSNKLKRPQRNPPRTQRIRKHTGVRIHDLSCHCISEGLENHGVTLCSFNIDSFPRWWEGRQPRIFDSFFSSIYIQEFAFYIASENYRRWPS
jgi:hypothetical protein